MRLRYTVALAALLAVSTPAFAGNYGPLQAQDGLGALGLTNHGVVIGHGSSPAGVSDPGSSGNVLTSNGSSSDPTFQAPASQTGRLIGVQVFTSSGTYTPDAGTNKIVVEVQAPGGGSGGAAATSNQNAEGGSGGGGAFAEVLITNGFSGATITIGSPGAAGAAGANAGGTGGTTSFGSDVSCPGGGGGQAGNAYPATSPIVMFGADGGAACTISSGTTVFTQRGHGAEAGLALGTAGINISGKGGDSFLGSGVVSQATNGAGFSGRDYGGGASGGVSSGSSAAQPGGTGGAGIVIVWEYS